MEILVNLVQNEYSCRNQHSWKFIDINYLIIQELSQLLKPGFVCILQHNTESSRCMPILQWPKKFNPVAQGDITRREKNPCWPGVKGSVDSIWCGLPGGWSRTVRHPPSNAGERLLRQRTQSHQEECLSRPPCPALSRKEPGASWGATQRTPKGHETGKGSS